MVLGHVDREVSMEQWMCIWIWRSSWLSFWDAKKLSYIVMLLQQWPVQSPHMQNWVMSYSLIKVSCCLLTFANYVFVALHVDLLLKEEEGGRGGGPVTKSWAHSRGVIEGSVSCQE